MGRPVTACSTFSAIVITAAPASPATALRAAGLCSVHTARHSSSGVLRKGVSRRSPRRSGGSHSICRATAPSPSLAKTSAGRTRAGCPAGGVVETVAQPVGDAERQRRQGLTRWPSGDDRMGACRRGPSYQLPGHAESAQRPVVDGLLQPGQRQALLVAHVPGAAPRTIRSSSCGRSGASGPVRSRAATSSVISWCSRSTRVVSSSPSGR